MDRHLGDMYNRRVIREAWKMTVFSLEEKKTSKQGVADPGAGQDSKTYCEN